MMVAGPLTLPLGTRVVPAMDGAGDDTAQRFGR
eukprot:COSAG04_NODE_3928_length_2416_cov_2.244713_1_plen_32_part_10